MENAWVKKRREKTVKALETDVPELMNYCRRDLKFLNIVIEMDKVEAHDAARASSLRLAAWGLVQAGYLFELYPSKFESDLDEARRFIYSPDFEEYRLRLEGNKN